LGWLRREKKNKADSAEMIKALMNRLIFTEEGEISCDDGHGVLAEFAELQQQGENIFSLMPWVQKHLEMCPDCREEYQALLHMLDSE